MTMLRAAFRVSMAFLENYKLCQIMSSWCNFFFSCLFILTIFIECVGLALGEKCGSCMFVKVQCIFVTQCIEHDNSMI